MPRAVARRREGYTHEVEIDGHTIVVDEPTEAGGANLGPSPTRLIAGALASCTAITVELYAGRKGWELGDVEVVVDMEYGQSGVPTSFLVTTKLPKELSTEQQERLGVMARKCPVHRTLSGETEITIDDRIELI
jgi:putative redox protein